MTQEKQNFKTISTFLISSLLHPIILPTLGVALILNSGGYFSLFAPSVKYNIIGIVFAITSIIPLAIMPVLLYFGVFKKISMQTRSERKIPIMITASSHYLAYLFFKDFQGISVVSVFLLSSTTIILISLIINYFWKISLHMIGLGGLCGLLVMMIYRLNADLFIYTIIFLFLSGVVASSRLYLKAHSSTQIYSGFVIGLTVMVFFFTFS